MLILSFPINIQGGEPFLGDVVKNIQHWHAFRDLGTDFIKTLYDGEHY